MQIRLCMRQSGQDEMAIPFIIQSRQIKVQQNKVYST